MGLVAHRQECCSRNFVRKSKGGERTVMLESRRNVISKAKSCELDEHS